MTHKNVLPTLSEETIRTLKEQKIFNKIEFYAHVKALREAGWPLRAIADPLAVSRTAVTGWNIKYTGGTPLPTVEEFPKVEPKNRKNGAKRYKLTEEESAELLRLATEASTVRRFTDANAQSRKSAKVLEDLLYVYMQKGASLRVLSEACGVSRSSISQRLRKR